MRDKVPFEATAAGRLSWLAGALYMGRNEPPFSLGGLVVGRSSGEQATSATQVVKIDVLPDADLCEVRGHQLHCTDAAEYLRETLHIGASDHLVIVWRAAAPLHISRVSALLQGLMGAGYKNVFLTAVEPTDRASSQGTG